MSTNSASRTRGFALITALVIVAVIVSVTVAIAGRQQTEIAQLRAAIAIDEAKLRINQLELEAARVLRADRKISAHDASDEPWSNDTMVFVSNGLRATGEFEDLQQYFNLNNLVPDPTIAGSAGTGAGSLPPISSANTLTPGPAPSVSAATLGAGDSALGSSSNATVIGSEGVQAPVADINNQQSNLQKVDAIGCSGGFCAAEQELLAAINSGRLDLAASASQGTGAIEDFSPQALADLSAALEQAGLDTTALGASSVFDELSELPEASGQPGSAGRGRGNAQIQPWMLAEIQFRLLLAKLDIDPEIVPAILDWIDPDSNTRFPNGAEDEYYGQLDEPYRSANRHFADISELRLVRGITEEIYERLRPFVTVLPITTAINVNTAPIEILMSLGPGIDEITAEQIVNAREAQPYLSIGEFTNHPALFGRPLLGIGVTVDTQFLVLNSTSRAGPSNLYMSSMFSDQPGVVQVFRRVNQVGVGQ
ncbi:MAG: type II secretion system minor pseudopilin GspK [Pseudomonadota bacterium]